MRSRCASSISTPAASSRAGSTCPRGKHRVAWEDADHLLVATDWKPGELTPSGYPYVVKRLTRGQPMSAAVEVYRGDTTDGGYGVSPNVLRDGQGRQLAVIERPLDTFSHQTYVVTARGAERLAIPDKADVEELIGGRVIVRLNEAWPAAGPAFTPGAVAELDLAAVKAAPGNLKPKLVWTPGPRDSLAGVTSTRDKLLITTLSNVNGRAWVYSPKPAGGWTSAKLALPDNLSVGYGATEESSNLAFVSASGFLTPSTLYLADTATAAAAPAPVKTLSAKFDASKDMVEQLEATSSDGTKIPYFVVHRKDIKYDGTTPTLMTAYGGFQVSSTPSYSGANGKLWLERGGAFVLANIRGGGEFGPAWHEAGLGTKRQIIYDDFAAVAKDLIARKITRPRRLGIQGGSNGGLLMGVRVHPASRAVERGGDPGAAARHDPHLEDRGRRLVAGRIWRRQRRPRGDGVLGEDLALSEPQDRREIPRALHLHDHQGRSGRPAARPQVRRADGGDGAALLLLREYRGRARRGRGSEAGGAYDRADDDVSAEEADGLTGAG